MRTLIISDVHLGADGRIPHADGELCHLLTNEKWGLLVIVGDYFDFWEATFSDIKRDHAAVIATVRGMGCPVVYIPGNHDDAFCGFISLDGMQVEWPVFYLHSGDKKVAFLHGDTFSLHLPLLSRIAYWVTGVVTRICSWVAGPGVSFRRALRYSVASSGAVQKQFSDSLAKKAVAEVDADIIVTGHTHIPVDPCEIDGKIYANLGDFGPEHLSYAVLEDGVLTLKKLA
jgi:UDP-2,3-diacylglucosamine pyrophosphatase LpxH